MKPRSRTRGGFTLLEAAVSLSLLGVIGGIFMLTTDTTTSAVRTGVAVAELDARVVRSVARVCETLKSASPELSTPQAIAPFSGTSLDFQRGLGSADDGTTLWGPLEHYELQYDEADDGVDNDGDGLVDEGTLIWIENEGVAGERRVVVCNDVREYLEGETFDGQDENGNGLIDERGFALDFAQDGQWVQVHLSLEGSDKEGRRIVSSAERTIAFRNVSD